MKSGIFTHALKYRGHIFCNGVLLQQNLYSAILSFLPPFHQLLYNLLPLPPFSHPSFLPIPLSHLSSVDLPLFLALKKGSVIYTSFFLSAWLSIYISQGLILEPGRKSMFYTFWMWTKQSILTTLNWTYQVHFIKIFETCTFLNWIKIKILLCDTNTLC